MTMHSRRRLLGLLGTTALTPVFPSIAAVPKTYNHAAIMAILNARMDAACKVMQQHMEDAIMYGTGPLARTFGPSHGIGGLGDLVQIQRNEFWQ